MGNASPKYVEFFFDDLTLYGANMKTEEALKILETNVREIHPDLLVVNEPDFRTLTLRTPEGAAFPVDKVYYFSRNGSWLLINKAPRAGESKSLHYANTKALCESLRSEATSDFVPNVMECCSCNNIVVPDADRAGCGSHCPECQTTL
jgi:hypothetical protein